MFSVPTMIALYLIHRFRRKRRPEVPVVVEGRSE